MGGILVEEGSYDEAIEKFQEASLILPTAARPHLLIGRVLLKRYAYSAALEHFQEAARLEPTSNLVKEDLSAAYHALGAESAVKGDWAAAYNALGAESAARGDSTTAEGYFLKALALSPYDTDYLCNLAKARVLLGQFEASATVLHRGLVLLPGDAWCQDLPEDASPPAAASADSIERLRRAVEIVPEIPQFRLYLIRSYLSNLRACEAMRQCDEFRNVRLSKRNVPFVLQLKCEEARKECA